MKYTALFTLLLLAGIAGKGQNKGDTTRAESRFEDELFQNIVLLMQQNKELSDRLNRAEKRIDTLATTEAFDFFKLAMKSWAIDSLRRKIDSLERRPYLFIDNKGVRPGLWLTNAAGEFQIFVAPL